MIRLGGLLKTDDDDPWKLAKAYREFGYRSAICPQVKLADKERIQALREAFQHEDVLLAEVGCWTNLVDPDDENRKRNLNYAYDRLALTDEIGALCCITYIGSVAPNAPHDPHPFNLTQDGFDLAVDTIRNVIDTVKPKKAKFTLELMQWVLPDSPEACLDLIKAVDRPAFAAHLDPVNIILSPRQYFNNGQLIERCFKLLAPWIVSCHAKDIVMRNQLALHFDETMQGTGNLDYKTYFRELNKLPGDIPLILEHLDTNEAYATARDNLTRIAKADGILFRGAEG